ncbi:unnamed protein product [Rhizoctonia solani]|uniref:Major facilitator superfamily (MFS) profile domain-containing protein n=1 Tax=Rhizoctonia solani TaxID=456999 RepID=A0A8H3ADA5_9AGAM|nr:unnamed protein product [Rhizoctonia solani]
MSSPPESSQSNTNVLLSVAPTGLRERRASGHAATNVRGILSMTGITTASENAILDIEDADPVKEDVKQPALIPQIPTLSQLPSLYIDKQSASISGYTPGSLTPGYSGSNTPAAVGREAYFEDAFKSSGDIVEHNSDTPRLKRRLALSFFGFFCAGWSDGITGTVLPRFEETYHVDYLTVSLLFVASTIGFAIGTIIIEPLFNSLGRFSLATRHRRFFPVFPSHISRVETGISLSQGRCGVLFFGGLSQAIYFTIAASKAPFPAMIVGFGFSGIGISLLSGQYNAFVAAQKSAGRYLGWLHGFYGVGAFASPLVGQTLLARGWQWPRFFIISVCLGCLNTVLILYTFHTTKQEFQEEKAKAIELLRQEPGDIELEARTNDGEVTIASRAVRRRSRSRSAGERSERDDDWRMEWVDPDTVGYVASGFWGGLAVGRLLLGQMSPYIGLKREKHLVHIYIVPSFVGNAFCTAIVGFVLGPIFPTSLSLATKLLPAEIHMTALATMSSFASIGSALYPFITGVIANTKGVAVLQPMMLGILSVMAGLWCFFPTRSIA